MEEGKEGGTRNLHGKLVWMEGVVSPFKCGVPDSCSPSDAQTMLIAPRSPV